MRSSILFFLILFSTNILSQPPVIQWEKVYGGLDNDIFYSMVMMNDSNIGVSGNTGSSTGYITNNHGGSDVWLVELDIAGNIRWNNCYGGISEETGYSLYHTIDNGFIIGASAHYNDGDVSGVHNASFIADDYWIIKTDSLGVIEWKRCYGGSGNDYISSIVQCTDTGYFVVGGSSSNDYDVSGNHGPYDLWALKIESGGNIQWSKSLGGSGDDDPVGYQTCAQTSDGNYLAVAVTFSTNGDVTGRYGAADIWVVKLDSVGQIIWQKCYGGTGLDNGSAILPSSENGFFLAGYTDSNDGLVSNSIGNGDMWLFKADSLGNILWAKCYGGLSIEQANSMAYTTDGGLILAGNCFASNGQVSGSHGWRDFWVVKVDSLGNFEWSKALGGSQDDVANAILQTPDGGFMVAGYTKSNDGDVSINLGGTDAWVIKLSPPGLSINEPQYNIMDIAIFQDGNNASTRFFSRVNEEVSFEIYNLAGQRIAENMVRIGEGINYFSLPGNYKTGSYCLKISWKNYIQSKMFVVAE